MAKLRTNKRRGVRGAIRPLLISVVAASGAVCFSWRDWSAAASKPTGEASPASVSEEQASLASHSVGTDRAESHAQPRPLPLRFLDETIRTADNHRRGPAAPELMADPPPAPQEDRNQPESSQLRFVAEGIPSGDDSREGSTAGEFQASRHPAPRAAVDRRPSSRMAFGLFDAQSQPSSVLRVVSASHAETVASQSQPASPLTLDFEDRPITSLTTSIADPPGDVPESVAPAKLAELGQVSYESVAVRDWTGLRYCWDAPAVGYRPLYFEEVNLERYGYGPKYLRAFQPVLSGAQFFATVPALPYLMAAEPPCERVYALGHYRPGSPAPYRIHYPPLSLRGGVAEAGVATALILAIP